ncbi:hypothetical protein [Aquipuribacter sp. SD81]|uniref:hypothetical protein n=1 Tax=Aquipuribacter sp. SD81 TaxID=3127703 RepID=UPI00301ADC71
MLLGAFPAWWVLGLGVLGFLLATVPMVAWLARLRRVATPPGTGWWLMFLLWAAAGALVLGADAPGTQPTTPAEQAVGYVFRLAWYVAATVVLLYVGNQSRDGYLSDVRLQRLLASLFLVTVAGGYIGFLLPDLAFRSPVERLLPSGLPGAEFLGKLAHPAVAQQMDIGVDVTRPSAPYVYANDWGAMYGLLLPWFVVAWTAPGAGWRRHWFLPVLAISFPPAVFSLNRGLWLGLAAVALFLGVRAALQGRFAAVAALGGAAVATGSALVLTPLGALVGTRLDNQHSNSGRTELAVRSVSAVLEGSPLLGFGSTRDVQGNFFSIAGGDSAACIGCSTPQLGTQGHLWLLLFAHGLVGTLLFVLFLLRRALPLLRDSGGPGTAALASVLFFLAVSPFYDLAMLPLFVLMAVLGMAWRAEDPVEVANPLSRTVPTDAPWPRREVARE